MVNSFSELHSSFNVTCTSVAIGQNRPTAKPYGTIGQNHPMAKFYGTIG